MTPGRLVELRRRARAAGLALCAACALGAGGGPDAHRDARPRSAAELLDCGFRSRFDLEFAQVIDVQTRRDGRPIRRYRLQIALRRIDGRNRFLAVFLAPPDERGTKLLTIENHDRRDDHFLYLPFLDKVKRIYGGRRQEAFLGTDFTFEDMERLHAEDFHAALRGTETLAGEETFVVRATPRDPSASGYAQTDYLVAASDCQIVEMRHFKEGAGAPFKVVETPRADMRRVDGVLVPTRAVARNLESRKETEVRFLQTHLDPDLAARYFEPSILERLNTIPGLPRSEASER